MDDDIIQEFLTESYETIDELDQAFVELEHDPTSSDLLAQIFRSIHTIKGTAGFFAFGNLESLTHAGENLLSKLREGALLLNADMTDALLSMVDATRLMLNEVASTGSDGDNAFAELVGELHRLTNGEPGGANEATTPNASVSDDVETAEHASESVPEDDIEAVAAAPDESSSAEGAAEPSDVEPAEALSSDGEVPPADTAAPSGGTSATQALAAQGIEPSALTESSIRVDVNLLDRLMNLTGELVLARNQVLQFHASAGDHTFQATAQQLDLITTEMQESVMQTRMQPIGNIWGKFPRIVRDLAAQLDKQVDLVMVGKETELDKTLVEAIKDPLTHIVRNSVDHGIESPADRVAAGKPATGRLELRSFHEGGQVIVEIADDGKGLDLAKIRATAVKRGVLTEDQANRLTDRQAAELIFNAGFSTADKVTNVSGRGVGMDVVRTNVEKIGGSIDIDTVFGQGTTLTVKIPLTLAIIPALIVTCDEDYFMIPQVSLVEVLHIAPEGNQQIEQVGDAEVFRLRGSLLPVVHLREVLGFPDEPERREIDGTDIVVLQADGQQFGLVVDQINDTEEIVVKPLAPNLKHLAPFGGTTIMGDGQVSLILDAIGIAATSGVAQDATKGPASSKAAVDDGDRRSGGPTTLLVARVGENRIALPVALVSRLEELPRSEIELAAGHEVMQYRGSLLRLVHVGRALGFDEDAHEQDEPLSIVVHEKDDEVFGFIVDEILDVHDVDLSEANRTDVVGVAASTVVGNRVTDAIDLEELIELAIRTPIGLTA